MPEDPSKTPTLFGRQKSKKLSARQQQLVETLLPKLKCNPEGPNTPLLDWVDGHPLWLEIGFGGGEHLAAMAEQNRDVKFIGCEPFLNGIAKMLTAIEEKGLDNVRLYDHDARHILKWLPNQSLNRVYLLYPDPWPKKRHHKRRFVTNESLSLLAKTMQPGAGLIIASDIGDYIRTSLLALDQSSDFIWQPTSPSEWRTPPEGWSGTRYEQKAIREGRTPTYLKIKRK